MASSSKSLKKSEALQRRAVVDIGSNSVRLVIYEGSARAPISICNEKALCGLGRDMTSDGRLNPGAVTDAVATLARFRRILDEFGSPQVYAIATAAVRDAKDGDKFVAADYIGSGEVFADDFHGHRASVIGSEKLQAIHIKLAQRR